MDDEINQKTHAGEVDQSARGEWVLSRPRARRARMKNERSPLIRIDQKSKIDKENDKMELH